MAQRLAVIAAGGTGGHLFPAQALAEVLKARGWRIVLATDERVAGMSDTFPAEEQVGLPAATLSLGNPVKAGDKVKFKAVNEAGKFTVTDLKVVR